MVPLPPPLFYGLAFGAGIALHTVTAPLSIGDHVTRVGIGAMAVGLGVALAGSAAAHARRHHTTINPHRPVSVLVTDGPFRFSRNPMYTGLAITYVGATLLTDTWWPLITLPAALLALQTLVIVPEERYLTERFERTYGEYAQRTRRWL